MAPVSHVAALRVCPPPPPRARARGLPFHYLYFRGFTIDLPPPSLLSANWAAITAKQRERRGRSPWLSFDRRERDLPTLICIRLCTCPIEASAKIEEASVGWCVGRPVWVAMADEPRGAPVGLLFIVFGAGAAPKKVRSYVNQLVPSAARARSTNPNLPIGLITDRFVNLSAAPAERLAAALTHTLVLDLRRAGATAWAKRLHGTRLQARHPRALASSRWAVLSTTLAPPGCSTLTIAI